MFSESDVAGLQAPALQGTLTQDQALTQLLAGSGLKYEFFKPGAVIIKRVAATPAPPTAQTPQSTADFKEVIVTGRAGIEQRTKEETSYSVTTIDQKKLRLQGPTSVTESLEVSAGLLGGVFRRRGQR